MRAELFDMIDECTTVNSNMVITKSVSRVDRNTQDSLKYMRLSQELCKPPSWCRIRNISLEVYEYVEKEPDS